MNPLMTVYVRIAYGNRILIDLTRTACTPRQTAVLLINAFAQAGMALAKMYVVGPESYGSRMPITCDVMVTEFRIV